MGGGIEICPWEENDSMSFQPRRGMQKFEVYREILQRLRDSGNEEVSRPGFEDLLCDHFNRLPSRYATDVNVKQPEDIIMHMKLLHRAGDPATRPAFEVRIVQVLVSDVNCGGSTQLNPPIVSFGLSPSLEVAHEATSNSQGGSGADGELPFIRRFFEITFSTVDKPKLLSQLTSLLSDIGLNIQEAHAFSTSDGYSLDIFVVDGWPCQETEQLKRVLEREIPKIEIEDVNTPYKRISSCLKIEQTANALQEARAHLQLLEKVHALAIQEDLEMANAATSSQQLSPEDSLLKDVLIRFSM